tara:strand:+ start:215 stop:517 length:303 start_codon:yes stop_codon:yes gene_type:complete
MTSIDRTLLKKINKLEEDVKDHGITINMCLDLIQDMNDSPRDVKMSTPEKIQERWKSRREKLLREANVSLGRTKKKSKKRSKNSTVKRKKSSRSRKRNNS